MTFPASYNISYYMGDTHEFNVYPRTSVDSDGDGQNDQFPLAGYSVDFTIAARRGDVLSTDPESVSGYAEFSNDRTYIKCAITPAIGLELNAGQTYIYDVTISKADTDYDKVYTLLTGNLSIQDRVDPVVQQSIASPDAPVSITVASSTESGISLSWSASETGGAPDGYYAYLIPYSVSYESTVALQQLADALALATPTDVSDTSVTFTSTTAVPALGIDSEPLQPATAYIYAIAAYNTAGTSDPAGNFDITAGTVDELYVEAG